jgi:hypothetical protein
MQIKVDNAQFHVLTVMHEISRQQPHAHAFDLSDLVTTEKVRHVTQSR